MRSGTSGVTGAAAMPLPCPRTGNWQTLAVRGGHQSLQRCRGMQVKSDYTRLGALIAAVERPGFQRLLVRRLVQWRDTGRCRHAAARMALQLEPGCAQGRPLRALAVQGNDSKFLSATPARSPALLDDRFDGARPAARGWWFLARCRRTTTGCSSPRWPWPAALCTPACVRQRAANDTVPAHRILLVENERCLHQLPLPGGGHHRRAGRRVEPGLAGGALATRACRRLLGETWTPGACTCWPAHAATCHICRRC